MTRKIVNLFRSLLARQVRLYPGEVPVELNVGFQIGLKSSYILATIGRNGDFTVEGSSISQI